LFEGIVMRANLVLILIPRASRRFLGGRSDAIVSVRIRQPSRYKTTKMHEKRTYEASIPNFGRTLLSVRGGGWRLKGEAGIALLPSSPEVK
jgi:hypothetical protein